MAKYYRTEINCETGEENLVELSADEAAEVESFAQQFKDEAELALAKEEQKQAILDRLGLTPEEAKLLLS